MSTNRSHDRFLLTCTLSSKGLILCFAYSHLLVPALLHQYSTIALTSSGKNEAVAVKVGKRHRQLASPAFLTWFLLFPPPLFAAIVRGHAHPKHCAFRSPLGPSCPLIYRFLVVPSRSWFYPLVLPHLFCFVSTS